MPRVVFLLKSQRKYCTRYAKKKKRVACERESPLSCHLCFASLHSCFRRYDPGFPTDGDAEHAAVSDSQTKRTCSPRTPLLVGSPDMSACPLQSTALLVRRSLLVRSRRRAEGSKLTRPRSIKLSRMLSTERSMIGRQLLYGGFFVSFCCAPVVGWSHFFYQIQ
jgi:hypothetical protein